MQSTLVQLWEVYLVRIFTKLRSGLVLSFLSRLLFTTTTAFKPSARKLILILSLKTLSGLGQCDSVSNSLGWSGANPSFISLYNNGYCISDSISDTTLYFKFLPDYTSGFFNWGFSSPNGYNLSVEEIVVYSNQCTVNSTGQYFPNQPATADTLIVSFKLRTTYIDNFCPYFVPFNGLAVEFGEVHVSKLGNLLVCNWFTHSETNSDYFIVELSPDAINFFPIANAKSAGNSSLRKDYSVEFESPFYKSVYLRICEIDLNGGRSYSSVMVFYHLPNLVAPVYRLGGYDYSGRKISSH